MAPFPAAYIIDEDCTSGQHDPDPCESAEVHECGVEMLAVPKAGIFICPVLKQLVDVAMHCDETVRPERNAALPLALFHLIFSWLEDGGASENHVELAVDALKSAKHSLSDLAHEAHGEAPCFTLRWNTVHRKTGRADLPGK